MCRATTNDTHLIFDSNSAKLHLRHERTNGQRGKQADTKNRIWCILTLNVTSGGSNFNDFPDNQLTKFRVFIG